MPFLKKPRWQSQILSSVSKDWVWFLYLMGQRKYIVVAMSTQVRGSYSNFFKKKVDIGIQYQYTWHWNSTSNLVPTMGQKITKPTRGQAGSSYLSGSSRDVQAIYHSFKWTQRFLLQPKSGIMPGSTEMPFRCRMVAWAKYRTDCETGWWTGASVMDSYRIPKWLRYAYSSK